MNAFVSLYILQTMKKRILAACMLIAYSIVLMKVMVFKDLPIIRIGAMMFSFGGTHEGTPNLWPFKTILPYLLGEKGWLIAAVNIVGNIILLVPVGLLVPFIVRGMTWQKICWLSVCTGFAIELLQTILHVGIFDIDDIILNAAGTLLGYGVYRKMANRGRRTTIAVVMGVVAMGIATATLAIYYQVHIVQPDALPKQTKALPANNPASNTHIETLNSITAEDPCAGTGGTGKISSVGSNSITITQNNNTSVVINLTTRTSIRNAAGNISKSDLHVGDRVTLVVDLNGDGTGTATTVLVCQALKPQLAR